MKIQTLAFLTLVLSAPAQASGFLLGLALGGGSTTKETRTRNVGPEPTCFIEFPVLMSDGTYEVAHLRTNTIDLIFPTPKGTGATINYSGGEQVRTNLTVPKLIKAITECGKAAK